MSEGGGEGCTVPHRVPTVAVAPYTKGHQIFFSAGVVEWAPQSEDLAACPPARALGAACRFEERRKSGSGVHPVRLLGCRCPFGRPPFSLFF